MQSIARLFENSYIVSKYNNTEMLATAVVQLCIYSPCSDSSSDSQNISQIEASISDVNVLNDNVVR